MFVCDMYFWIGLDYTALDLDLDQLYSTQRKSDYMINALLFGISRMNPSDTNDVVGIEKSCIEKQQNAASPSWSSQIDNNPRNYAG